jgi:hypothetical protein
LRRTAADEPGLSRCDRDAERRGIGRLFGSETIPDGVSPDQESGEDQRRDAPARVSSVHGLHLRPYYEEGECSREGTAGDQPASAGYQEEYH